MNPTPWATTHTERGMQKNFGNVLIKSQYGQNSQSSRFKESTLNQSWIDKFFTKRNNARAPLPNALRAQASVIRSRSILDESPCAFENQIVFQGPDYIEMESDSPQPKKIKVSYNINRLMLQKKQMHANKLLEIRRNYDMEQKKNAEIQSVKSNKKPKEEKAENEKYDFKMT